MVRHALIVFAVALGVAVPGAAFAQRSLFDAPADAAAAPNPAAAAPAKPRPQPRRAAKPAGPTPARTLQVTNATAMPVARLEVSGGGLSVALAKPLAPNAKTTLRLPAFKSCAVTVDVTFQSQPIADSNELDICQEKTIRLTD